MLCDCEFFAKVRCELLCAAVQSSHFTVNVSSKMVAGVVWCPVPWYPGVCRGTSQCCSESEHWRGCSTDSPTSDGRQQSSCSLSPSGDPSLSSANLLIQMLMFCMKYSLLRDEDMMATFFTLNFEFLEEFIWFLISGSFFTGKHAGCWLVSQDLLSPPLGAYFQIIMHLVQL